MAHKTFIDGTIYNVSGGKTLIDGSIHTLKGGRTFVDGTGYDIAFSSIKPLSEFDVGEILLCRDWSGELHDFVIAAHKYSEFLNPEGKTLMVMMEPLTAQWGKSADPNTFEGSLGLQTLVKDFVGRFPGLQSVIGTQIYSSVGNTVANIGVPVFLLSLSELGLSSDYANIEGDAVDLGPRLIDAWDQMGVPIWTRTPVKGSQAMAFAYGQRRVMEANVQMEYCMFTAFTLPEHVPVNANTLEILL